MVPLRIDIDVEIGERLPRAEEGADPQPPGQQRRDAEQQPRDERRRKGCAEDADFASASWRPSKASVATSSDSEADPRDRAAAGDGRPAYGWL